MPASEDICLNPKPPSLIGRDIWTHCVSVSCGLVRSATAERSRLSNLARANNNIIIIIFIIYVAAFWLSRVMVREAVVISRRLECER